MPLLDLDTLPVPVPVTIAVGPPGRPVNRIPGGRRRAAVEA